MSLGLRGTGRVADDLWLLAHADVTGKPYIQPRPLGLGLAAALLAELALARAISVAGDQIAVTGRARKPLSGLAPAPGTSAPAHLRLPALATPETDCL